MGTAVWMYHMVAGSRSRGVAACYYSCLHKAELLLLVVLLFASSGFINAVVSTTNKHTTVDYCQIFNVTAQGEDNSTFSAGDVLRGRHLRTAFTHWSPFLVVDDNGVLVGGHDLELLDEIARRAGFTYSRDVIVKWENESTWDDALLRAAKQYDLMGQWWIDTSQRRTKGVVIGKHIVDISQIMVTRKETGNSKSLAQSLTTVLAPFSPMLWATILLLILASSLFMWFLERGINFIDFPSSHPWYLSMIHSTYLGFSSLTGAAYHSPQTGMGKLFAVGFSFVILITVGAYTANLANYLVAQSNAKAVYNGLDDVLRANKVCCVLEGSTIGLGEEYAKLQKFEVYDVTEMYTALMDGHCVAGVAGLAELQLMMARGEAGCELELVGQFMTRAGGGFATSMENCKPMLAAVLDTVYVTLEEEGFVQKLWSNYTKGSDACAAANSATSAATTGMGVADFGGVIILVAMFMAVTLIGGLFFRNKLWRVRSKVGHAREMVKYTSRLMTVSVPRRWSTLSKVTRLTPKASAHDATGRLSISSSSEGGAIQVQAFSTEQDEEARGVVNAAAWSDA